MHPFIYRAPCTATAEMDQLDDSQPCRTSPHAAALRFLLFLVFLDLLSTIIAPATVGYLIYLIYMIASSSDLIPLWAIVLLAAVYGLQAIIFILKRKWGMV